MTLLPPTTRRLLENLLSSYAYVGLMALITLFVVPIYLRTLGASAWGSVALCVTLQGFLFALDVALGPLMLRDVARAATAGRAQQAYARFLRMYLLPALLAFVVGQLVLVVVVPATSDLLWALRVALIQFLFQFSNNAAIGYWNAQERQRFANLRLAGFALLKHATALILLTQWQATAVVYMLPFAAISAIEFTVNNRRIRRERRTSDSIATESGTPLGLGDWRDAAGYGAAAALGLITAQIDRGFLSLALSADRYGIYFLISSLMLSLLSLQVPIQRAFLPRMATAHAPRDVASSMFKVLLIVLVVPSLAIAAFPELMLRLWLRDPAIAQTAALPFRLLMLAVALNALYAPIGAMLLQQHRNGTLARINATILCVQLMILATFTTPLGMTAGAIAWLACGMIQAGYAAFFWWTSRATT